MSGTCTSPMNKSIVLAKALMLYVRDSAIQGFCIEAGDLNTGEICTGAGLPQI